MNNNPLVSIITPCYNGERFIHRFFDSIIKQTYNNIELIFIDDGSTDNTAIIAKRYGDLLTEKGVRFVYCYQENKGQASAINKGLDLIRGDYLTWPDSDDWLDDRCIEIKVKLFQEHPEWGMICCRTAAINECDAEKGIYKMEYIMERKSKDSKNFFLDLILENDVYFAPGGYMVRTRLLLSELKDNRIFEGKGGQNWQLLLPIAYKYECGFIDDILYFYLLRTDSHSRNFGDLTHIIQRTYEHQTILEATVNNLKINISEKHSFLVIIEKKYALKRYRLSMENGAKEDKKMYYGEMKKHGLVDYSTRLEYFRKTNAFGYYALRIIHFPNGIMRRIKNRLVGC